MKDVFELPKKEPHKQKLTFLYISIIQKSYFWGKKVEIQSWQTSVVHNIPTDKRDSFPTLFFVSSAGRRFEKLGKQLIEYLSKKCFISISTKYWGVIALPDPPSRDLVDSEILVRISRKQRCGDLSSL